jgi:rRNA small subunit pseudouridine methyltransferase Nep1
MSIHLMLVDAEIEALPTEAIPGSAPRRSGMPGTDKKGIRILDSNLHRDLMSSIPDCNRRGRPDIAHAFLTMTLSSAPWAEGRMDVLVHTRGNIVIRFARKATIDRDYVSFLATMTELFEKGEIGERDERIWMETDRSVSALLEEERLDFIIALSPDGSKENLRAVLSEQGKREIGLIIGGFPEGDYISPVYELADLAVSLGDEILTVPEVTAQVLAAIP